MLVLVMAGALSGCNQHMDASRGTPEYAAALVSRGYNCGLHPNRSRIVAGYSRDERVRFVSANSAYAVRSYNRPVHCGEIERAQVARDLQARSR